jgi:hypothetical protein
VTKFFGFLFPAFIVVFTAGMVGGCTGFLYLGLAMLVSNHPLSSVMDIETLFGIVFLAGTCAAMVSFALFGFFRVLDFAPMLVISFVPIALVVITAKTLGAPSALTLILLIGLVIRSLTKKDALSA